jgi:hypothetical protein
MRIFRCTQVDLLQKGKIPGGAGLPPFPLYDRLSICFCVSDIYAVQSLVCVHVLQCPFQTQPYIHRPCRDTSPGDVSCIQ